MTPNTYKQYRKALGLTQTELAERLGVTRQCITLRETGRAPINKEAELAIERLILKENS